MITSQLPWRSLVVVAGVALLGLALARLSAPVTVEVPQVAVAPVPHHSRWHTGHDELSCVLNSAPEMRPDNGRLTKGDIVWGMSKIKSQVAACYDDYGVPGLANVSVTIAADGHVESASVSGSLSQTPSGDCVERAVRGASFRAVKLPITINYPFMLR